MYKKFTYSYIDIQAMLDKTKWHVLDTRKYIVYIYIYVCIVSNYPRMRIYNFGIHWSGCPKFTHNFFSSGKKKVKNFFDFLRFVMLYSSDI